jgi:hypothetical protein
MSLPRALGGDAKPVGHHPRQGRSDGSAQTNEQGLNGETLGVLFFGKIVRHQGPERLHAGIDGAVQHPEQSRRHPNRRAIRHQDQGQRRENRAAQNKRTPPAQPRPDAVAVVPDQGLDDHAGYGRGQPQNGQGIGVRPEVAVNGAHVGHLQPPAKLDAEKAEAHVSDLPEIQARFLHVGIVIVKFQLAITP